MGGLISATTLVGWATYRSKRLEALIEGRPLVLIHDGQINYDSLNRVKMTIHELKSALRAEGFAREADVRFAIVENNGHVTVIPIENHNGHIAGTAPQTSGELMV